MNQDFAQRRRVAVALAITVIAVPAAFLLNRTGDTSCVGQQLAVVVVVVGHRAELHDLERLACHTGTFLTEQHG